MAGLAGLLYAVVDLISRRVRRLVRGAIVLEKQRSVHRVPLLIDNFDVVEQPLDGLRVPDVRA